MQDMIQRKEEFKEKKHWAVVGATTDEGKFGYKIVKILKDSGYEVYPINPKYEKVCGLKCYSDVADLPMAVEVVNIVLNQAFVPALLDALAQKNLKRIWFQPNTYNPQILKKALDMGFESVYGHCIYADLL